MVKCPFKIDFGSLGDGPSGYFGTPIATDISGYDLIFAAIPYECDDTAKPGSKKGSQYFRRDHFGFGFCDQGLDIDMAHSIKAADCGDLVIDSSSKENAAESIRSAVETIISTDAVCFTIGGDDMTAYPQIKAAYEKYGKLSVIHFGGTVSTSLMKAVSEGMCENSSCVEVGIRNGMSQYSSDIEKYGINVIKASDFDYMKLTDIGEKVKEIVGNKPAVVLFDVNFYDPAYVTSAAKPYPGGMSAYETVAVFESGLVGLSIKSMMVYGMLDYNDPGETSLNNMAEAACKLYAVAAYNIASEKDA